MVLYEARIVLVTENNNTAFYFDFVPYCTSKCTSKLRRCFTTFHQYTWSTKSYNIRWWFVLYKNGNTDVCSFKQYFVEILYCWSSVVPRFFEQLILRKWSYRLRQNEDDFEGNRKCKQQSNINLWLCRWFSIISYA